MGNKGSFKKGHKTWNKGKEYTEIKGDKHWNWMGGKTELNRLIRGSVMYNDWRKKVYKRDNWTCNVCLEKQKNPVAHHIKSFKDYVEERFDVDNGITLCRACHIDIHRKNGRLQAQGTYQFIFS